MFTFFAKLTRGTSRGRADRTSTRTRWLSILSKYRIRTVITIPGRAKVKSIFTCLTMTKRSSSSAKRS
jgi:hypothetical protein